MSGPHRSSFNDYFPHPTHIMGTGEDSTYPFVSELNLSLCINL